MQARLAVVFRVWPGLLMTEAVPRGLRGKLLFRAMEGLVGCLVIYRDGGCPEAFLFYKSSVARRERQPRP